MTLILKKGLRFRNTWRPMDPDAAAYITAVETADGQVLEEKVKIVIDNFVLGCKTDGIWNAIKAGCILAGARTLTGALVPLVGTAPTKFGTEGGWNYDRKTGLTGNGTNNYLNSNRYLTSDPQDNQHLAVYHNSTAVGVSAIAGTAGKTSNPSASSTQIIALPDPQTVSRSLAGIMHGGSAVGVGIYGVSRGSSASYAWRANGGAVGGTVNETSTPSYLQLMYIFARSEVNGAPSFCTSSRLAFYSIGESLDLALLDARVTALVNALAVAIP